VPRLTRPEGHPAPSMTEKGAARTVASNPDIANFAHVADPAAAGAADPTAVPAADPAAAPAVFPAAVPAKAKLKGWAAMIPRGGAMEERSDSVLDQLLDDIHAALKSYTPVPGSIISQLIRSIPDSGCYTMERTNHAWCKQSILESALECRIDVAIEMIRAGANLEELWTYGKSKIARPERAAKELGSLGAYSSECMKRCMVLGWAFGGADRAVEYCGRPYSGLEEWVDAIRKAAEEGHMHPRPEGRSAEEAEARKAHYWRVVVPARELMAMLKGGRAPEAHKLIHELQTDQLREVLEVPMNWHESTCAGLFEVHTLIYAAIAARQMCVAAELLLARGGIPAEEEIALLIGVDVDMGGGVVKALAAHGVTFRGWPYEGALTQVWRPAKYECLEVLLSEQGEEAQRRCIYLCMRNLGWTPAVALSQMDFLEWILDWNDCLTWLHSWAERVGVELLGCAGYIWIFESLVEYTMAQGRTILGGGYAKIIYKAVPNVALGMLEWGCWAAASREPEELILGAVFGLGREYLPRLVRVVNAQEPLNLGRVVDGLCSTAARWDEFESALVTISAMTIYTEQLSGGDQLIARLARRIARQPWRHQGNLPVTIQGIRWSTARQSWVGTVVRGVKRRHGPKS
jgi:hypothetical protein